MAIDRLVGRDFENFLNALTHAFRDYADFRVMARTKLDLQLYDVVREGPGKEVAFGLIEWAEQEGRLEDLIGAVLGERPNNPRLKAFSYELLLNSPGATSPALEAIVSPGVPMADTALWRAAMERFEAAVCRVEMPAGSAAGTAFLIAEDLILTNRHVADQLARRSVPPGQCVARFDYRVSAPGAEPDKGHAVEFAEDWLADSSPVEALDFAIIRLASIPPGRSPLPAPEPHEFARNEVLLILQHPVGGAMKMAAGVYAGHDPARHRVSYTVNTEPGSSGSPVFTHDWRPVALHHAGAAGQNTGVVLLPVSLSTLAAAHWARAPGREASAAPAAAAPDASGAGLQSLAAAPAPSEDDLELEGLKEAASAPETRDQVGRFAEDIQGTSNCANRVGDLKVIHDLLDQVRHTVYAPLRFVAERFPYDGAERELAGYMRRLGEFRDRLAGAALKPHFEANDFPWLDGEVAWAADSLAEAFEHKRPAALDEALAFLRQVIEVQLPSLDSRLTEAARRLNLPDLVARLETLRDDLARGGADNLVPAVERDIGTLARIEGRLSALIALHNCWQQVDTFLNNLELALAQTVPDVARSWRLLESRLRQACPAGSAERTEPIDNAIEGFAAAVAALDATAIIKAFNPLSALLGNRFVAIDQELLGACGEIRKVGASLSEVVEKLDVP